MRRGVLWDSSAILALLDADDADHQRAVTAAGTIAAERRPSFITNYIEAEAHALLLRKLGRNIARAWLLSGGLPVVRVLPTEEERAKAREKARDMLEIARSRVSDPRVEFRVADAQDLQVSPGSFDAVVCQFGIMFCPDKALATSEAYSALKPGGRYLYSVWACLEDNPHCHILQELILKEFPEDPPMFFTVPFSSSDRAMNLQLMQDAGFAKIDYQAVRLPVQSESAESLAMGMVKGSPLFGMLEERNADTDAFAAKLAGQLGDLYGHRPFRSEMTAMFITGEKQA